MNKEETIQRTESTTSKYILFGMPMLGASILMVLQLHLWVNTQ